MDLWYVQISPFIVTAVFELASPLIERYEARLNDRALGPDGLGLPPDDFTTRLRKTTAAIGSAVSDGTRALVMLTVSVVAALVLRVDELGRLEIDTFAWWILAGLAAFYIVVIAVQWCAGVLEYADHRYLCWWRLVPLANAGVNIALAVAFAVEHERSGRP